MPDERRRALVAGCVAAAAFGLMSVASAPPISLWWLAMLAACPLVSVVDARTPRPWSLGLGVLIGSLPWWVWSHWWIWDITAIGFGPMMLALGACVAAPVLAVAWLRRRWARLPVALVFPVAWSGVETVRGEVLFHGYPWTLLGHPLIDGPATLSAPGASFGVYASSFMCAAAAAAIAAAARRRWRPAALAAAIAVLTLIIGVALAPAPETARGASLRVALVQTNLAQSNKLSWSIDDELEDFRRFEQLTVAAAAEAPDVIVWPETMMPGPAFDPDVLRQMSERNITFKLAAVRESGPKEIWATAFADRLLETQRELKIPMLIGAEGMNNGRIDDSQRGIRLTYDAKFNSVFLVRGGRIDPVRYDKLRLTPFGEVMPYLSSWPWLQDRLLDVGAGGMKFDLTAGTKPRAFDIAGAAIGREVRAATPICFEVADAGVCRRLVFDDRGGRRADVLINLTNDGWFGDSATGRLCHLQQAQWRCRQLATPMARAANTGISAVIDAGGRVLRSGAAEVQDNRVNGGSIEIRPKFNVDGVLIAELVPGVGRTTYGRVGELFGWVCLVLTGAMALGAIRFR